MKFQDLKNFLANFSLRPGGKHTSLNFQQYKLLVTVATKWYGITFGSWLADCFMAYGHAVEPGYEDSDTYFQFTPESWEELEEQFRSHERQKFTHSHKHPEAPI
jgi:hypothetical protein